MEKINMHVQNPNVKDRLIVSRLPLFIIFIITFCSQTATAKQTYSAEDTILIGGDSSFPPYEFLDESGNPTGYNVDLTRAIAEVMGMKVKIVLGTWGDMKEALKTGKVHALQGASYLPGRSNYMDFSAPHAIIHQSVFARRGEPRIKALRELKNKEVIVQRDGVMHDYLKEQAINAKLILTNTHADALRMLAAGKHNYALVANLPGLYLGQEMGLSNISPIAKPLKGQRYSYAVKKGNGDLLTQFSEGLAILNNTGRKQVIYDKWFAALEKGGFPWKKIGQISAVASGTLLLVLAAIVIWNRALHRRVERRTKELQLHQQKLIQADKMASLGILVSGVAHEINNPNGILLLNLPVVQEAFDDAKEILDAHYETQGDFNLGGLSYSRMRNEIPNLIVDMLASASRIKRIVNDLKNFSRQGSNDSMEDVSLNTVVLMAIRLVDNSIRKATNHFSTQYDNNLPNIKGNTQRIEQIVINLILNACQSLESKDKSIKVCTRYEHKEDKLILEVSDQGKGIDKEFVGYLTTPFFTTKRDIGGTGLGLFISTKIAQEHGGTLYFDSTPGKGTIVTLSLPRSMEVKNL